MTVAQRTSRTTRNVASPGPLASTDVPRQIGPWRIVGLAGEGAWTRVYRAAPLVAPLGSPADYALKVIRPDRATDPIASRLLQREEYVGRQVSHPHLSPVLSSRVDRPPFYLATPFLTGSTLAEVLASRAVGLSTVGSSTVGLRTVGLSVLDALWYVRQTAEALLALHAAGWIHGDIKPTNIFVGTSGHVTLIDLGFARRVDGPVDAHAVPWQALPLAGTPAYAAPEVHLAREEIGRPADIYSLGVTLFEALTGRRPFDERDPAALATAHCQSAPPALRDARFDLPDEAERLVTSMLAKDPSERPGTPDVIDALVELEIAALGDGRI